MHKFLSFEGCDRRQRFWGIALIGLVAYFFSGPLLRSIIYDKTPLDIPFWVILLGIGALYIPSTVRRIRDIGKKWYWIFSSLMFCISLFITFLLLLEVEPGGTSYKLILLFTSLIAPPFLLSGLVWLVTRQYFFKTCVLFTPIISSVWLLYILFFRSSRDENINSVNKAERNKFSYKDTYFTLSGRISLTQYWLLLIIPTAFLGLFSIGICYPFLNKTLDSEILTNLYTIAITLMVCIFSFCVLVKRLHDINASGWYLLITLIPVVGFLYIWVVTTFFRGDKENNRFGISHNVEEGTQLLTLENRIKNHFNNPIATSLCLFSLAMLLVYYIEINLRVNGWISYDYISFEYSYYFRGGSEIFHNIKMFLELMLSLYVSAYCAIKFDRSKHLLIVITSLFIYAAAHFATINFGERELVFIMGSTAISFLPLLIMFITSLFRVLFKASLPTILAIALLTDPVFDVIEFAFEAIFYAYQGFLLPYNSLFEIAVKLLCIELGIFLFLVNRNRLKISASEEIKL